MKPSSPFRRPPHVARRPVPYRPHIELLESRCLPSTVTNLLDTGPGSLRQAIFDTPPGGTVDFQSGLTGTIILNSNELVIDKNLTISGLGAAVMTVSGNNATRVFHVVGPVTVSISGLTIADGLVSSTSGGGIFNGATLTVTDCIISGNTATGSGGFGGGVGNIGTLTISRSTVSGNTAMGAGGGIVNFFGTMTITDSVVSGNTTPGNGGGINNNNGTMVITGSTVSGNSATDPSTGIGGGIINFAALAVKDCTLADNDATAFGGGIANGGPGLTVTSSTITGNVAGFGGGGIDAGPGPAISNTILGGNAGPSAPDVRGTLASQGHNLIGNGSGGSGFADTDLVGTAAHPIDPLLGPLQDNGGPTPTMALLSGSPALNAGDPTQLNVADQRGVMRSGGVNIGAYQASASNFVLTAPDTVTAGTPFDVSVTAVDPFGKTAVGYTGTVTFTSADPYGAALPADYTFTAADAGVYPVPGGATLYTAGTWDVTATDTGTGSITGGASVSVTPAAADHLLFVQQPTNTAAGQTITPAVMVAVVDQFGNVLTDDNSDTITLTISTNPSGGTLSGTLTLTVSGGIATFGDLSIDIAGDGYTLHATTIGLIDADSVAFSITA
jgi:hypothetical protein